MHHDDGKDPPGISLAGVIPGVFGSSTRAELASVIAALAKPGPLHIALDNLGVVFGVIALLEGILTSTRPWALRPDGDLWAIAEKAIALSGASSISVAWTKGHATWIHLLNGTSTYRDAIGNGFADAAADHGHKVVGRHDEQRVLDCIAAKQNAYATMMIRFQRYAIAILRADKDERDRRSFTYTGKTGTITWIDLPLEPRPRPSFEEGCTLSFMALPRNLEKHLDEIAIFWQNSCWAPNGKPTTWLEIYALFKLWGGESPRRPWMSTVLPHLSMRALNISSKIAKLS